MRGAALAFGFVVGFTTTATSARNDQKPLQAFPNLKSSGVTSDPNDVNTVYDYVVVGGGLTGITVAARLAENPSTTVLVIEAGRDDRTDPLVQDIYRYGDIWKPDCDLVWKWPTDHGRNITG